MTPVDQPILYHKYSGAGWEPVAARVIAEASVSLTVNGEVWLNFMCTPADLESLAVGFLYNEGFISTPAEVVSARACASGDNVDVWLTHAVERPARWNRTSGCNGGLTRSSSPVGPRPRRRAVDISPDTLLDCMDQLLTAQEVYRQSGGIHCSVLSDGGRVYCQAEDIGRHNTLDKLAGHALMEKIELSPRIVLTTGRVSSEMMLKSSRLGADVVVSRTSPTTRSIEIAQDLGITLVGYARRTQMLVYTHPQRLQGFSAPVYLPQFSSAEQRG
jgi:FdhD protein